MINSSSLSPDNVDELVQGWAVHHHNISTILKPSQAWEPNFRTILLFFFFYKTAVSIHKHYLVVSSSLCPASPAPVLEASPSRHSPFSYLSIGCHFVLGKSRSKKHAKTHLVLSKSDVQPSNLLSPGRQTYERPPQAHRTFK